MNIKKTKYGWKKDIPDFRDFIYRPAKKTLISLPVKINLRSECPPIYDQGKLGSCTANAIGAAFEFELIKQKLNDFTPSRLFIYYNERAIEGSVNEDSGAQIRDGIKSINKKGVCKETSWPYITSKFKNKPSTKCYAEALKNQLISYHSLNNNLNTMKSCLADGFPFVFGFSVYNSFESSDVAKTGTVKLPLKTENLLGGHAVCAVGYDDALQRFIIRNSWGEAWGKGGYFTMPYAYLSNPKLSSDFWTIRLVE